MAISADRYGKSMGLNPAISRSGFLRTAGVAGGAVAAAGLGASGAARAIGGDEPWDNKLYPTGNSRLDSSALQAAVERGGVVRLMSARGQYFNLLDFTIKIARSVTIIGQATKVKYGNAPAFSCDQAGVKLSIRNLRFMDIGQTGGISPFDFTKPARKGSFELDLSSVAIGGDEPWD